MFAALKAVGCMLLIMDNYWLGISGIIKVEVSVIVSRGTQFDIALENHALRVEVKISQ